MITRLGSMSLAGLIALGPHLGLAQSSRIQYLGMGHAEIARLQIGTLKTELVFLDSKLEELELALSERSSHTNQALRLVNAMGSGISMGLSAIAAMTLTPKYKMAVKGLKVSAADGALLSAIVAGLAQVLVALDQNIQAQNGTLDPYGRIHDESLKAQMAELQIQIGEAKLRNKDNSSYIQILSGLEDTLAQTVAGVEAYQDRRHSVALVEYFSSASQQMGAIGLLIARMTQSPVSAQIGAVVMNLGNMGHLYGYFGDDRSKEFLAEIRSIRAKLARTPL